MQACFTLEPYNLGYLPLIWLSRDLDYTETLLSSVINAGTTLPCVP